MQEDLVHLIHGVLHHGIRLRTRLLRGERLVLENEQATLQRLLLPAGEAQRWPEYGGQSPASTEPTDLHAADVHAGTGPRLFLGVRYALVCWLDELFLVGSPWEKQWNEKKLEAALYASNDRAWRFWEQARLAEARPDGTALVGFFLCVMLGFRGDLRDDPAALQAWLDATRIRLHRGNRTAWSKPPELQPRTLVPPLRGQERLRRMIYSGGLLLLVLLPILAFIMVQMMAPTPAGPGDAGYRTGASKADR